MGKSVFLLSHGGDNKKGGRDNYYRSLRDLYSLLYEVGKEKDKRNGFELNSSKAALDDAGQRASARNARHGWLRARAHVVET